MYKFLKRYPISRRPLAVLLIIVWPLLFTYCAVREEIAELKRGYKDLFTMLRTGSMP